jgi:DnaJ-class molecular chaperone
MRSIHSTNNARRRAERRRIRMEVKARMTAAFLRTMQENECGQCEGTGTVVGGLSGDSDDEECPVCDGTGQLPESDEERFD